MTVRRVAQRPELAARDVTTAFDTIRELLMWGGDHFDTVDLKGVGHSFSKVCASSSTKLLLNYCY